MSSIKVYEVSADTRPINAISVWDASSSGTRPLNSIPVWNESNEGDRPLNSIQVKIVDKAPNAIPVWFNGGSEPGPEPFNYRTVEIGNQTWMAEELTGDDGEGGVYIKILNNVNGYDLGTHYYYQFPAAVRMAEKYPGWHLPTPDDFNELIDYCGSKTAASNMLKSTYAWPSIRNGVDTYGFTMFPVGRKNECFHFRIKLLFLV